MKEILPFFGCSYWFNPEHIFQQCTTIKLVRCFLISNWVKIVTIEITKLLTNLWVATMGIKKKKKKKKKSMNSATSLNWNLEWQGFWYRCEHCKSCTWLSPKKHQFGSFWDVWPFGRFRDDTRTVHDANKTLLMIITSRAEISWRRSFETSWSYPNSIA